MTTDLQKFTNNYNPFTMIDLASTYVLRPRLLSWVSWNLWRLELDRSWIGVKID